MNKLVKLNGKYFVSGSGFSGSVNAATRMDYDEALDVVVCAANMGIAGAVAVDAPEFADAPANSFAVVYIRKKDVTCCGQLDKQAPNGALNEIDPSKRRFATFDEAVQHGSRFPARRKDKGDKLGTAGHRGFYVVETNDPVNSAVNWKTGLTNSI